jgi:acylglycerol lipase
MRHTEGSFTTDDGLKLFHQAWLPDAEPRAVVMLLHGLAEHSGRYEHVAQALTDAGYAVHAVDHRGHGRSEGKRVYVKSYDEYMADLVQFRALIEAEHPGLPLVVLGHSMGGNLALGHVLDHQHGVRGLALSGAALAPGESLSQFKIRLARAVSKIAPGMRPERLSAEAISRDPAVVAAYTSDPLVFTGKMTAGVAGALLGAMDRFQRRHGELTIPLLVMHGTEDRLTAIAGTRALEAGAVNATVTSHYYDGLYHEIFNEPEHDAVLGDLIAWLDVVTA